MMIDPISAGAAAAAVAAAAAAVIIYLFPAAAALCAYSLVHCVLGCGSFIVG
jgi:hypothetical protein